MGLAASQARLLTITSRLSSNELRQQNIANAKLRLSMDSDKISQEYSNALNNQTLKMNGVPLNYDDLVAAGYSVRKASDITSGNTGSSGAGPTSAGKSYTRYNESIKPSKTLAQLESEKPVEPKTPSACPPPTPQPPEEIYSDRFRQITDELVELRGLLVAYQYDYRVDRVNTDAFSEDYDTSELTNYQGYNDNTNVNIDAVKSRLLVQYDALTALLKDCGALDADGSMFEMRDLVESRLANDRTSRVADSTYSEYYSREASVLGYVNGIVTDKDAKNKQVYDAAVEAQKRYSETWRAYGLAKDAYPQKLANWEAEYATLKAQWNEYYASAETVTPDTTPTQGNNGTTSKTEDLPSQLRSNPDYLIQGLLSGYLALFDNEGKMVSLSSNNQITTEYDTTDDAAAEAKYNSAMAKINRKEKLLDTQAANLNTEYSALSTELESIKTIIQNHTSKDFEVFS